MKPEAQRIAIAKACGWKYDERTDSYKKDGETAFVGLNQTHYRLLPDYLNDLNAMHEAEKALTDEQCRFFANHLFFLTNPGDVFSVSLTSLNLFRLVNATAAQSSEAFLRTIGKWEESP